MLKKYKKKAFALQLDAEQYLLVFILLVGLGAFGWSSVQDYGRRDTAQADCTRIASAVSQYHFNNDELPTSLNALLSSDDGGPYLTDLPKDPWNHDYHYSISSKKDTFAVFTYANKENSGTAPDLNNPAKDNSHNETIAVISH